MAKWKLAGQLAVAMREAERQATEKRVQAEQYQESVRNGVLLRSLKRSRDHAKHEAKFSFINHERWYQSLQEEAEERQTDLAVTSCVRFQKEDERNKQRTLKKVRALDHHLQHAQKINAAIEMVRLKEKETDTEIQNVRLQLKEARKEQDRQRVAPPHSVFERVEMAHHRLGLQLAENRRLADRIKHLEGQRDQVVHINTQLKRDLEKLSKELGSHIEQAQTTYGQRDMNKRNISKLREHMSKSASTFANDMQLLQFKIDVLRRMERFMTTKNKQRHDEGKERRLVLRQQLSCTEKDLILLRTLMDKISYDLEESDMRQIISTFLQLQMENFMLFKNIVHTRDTCHAMQVEIEDLKQRLGKLLIQKRIENEEAMERKLELWEKINMCRREAEMKEMQLKDANQVIATYIRGIRAMLTKMHYTEQDITRLAGMLKRIEERNIRVFMAEMENYINNQSELYTAMEYFKWREARRLSMSLSQARREPLPPRQEPCRRVVVVPPQPCELSIELQEDSTSLSAFQIEPPPVRPLEFEEMTHELQRELGSGGLRIESSVDMVDHDKSRISTAEKRRESSMDKSLPKMSSRDEKTSQRALHSGDKTTQFLQPAEIAAHRASSAPDIF